MHSADSTERCNVTLLKRKDTFMSRSYKKHPIYKRHEKGGKKTANRRVRHSKDSLQYAGYKRLTIRWLVYEYRFRCTYAEMIKIHKDKELGHMMMGWNYNDDTKWWYKAYRWK